MIPVPEDVLVNAVEKAAKSVVNIASVRMLQDQLFRVFPVEGVGSGVVIDEKGYILTNNHVIDDAERLKVTLTDGRVLRGRVVGSDEVTDLAVIKVEAEQPLPAAELGNSDELKAGQIVMAIGNPFGLTGGPAVTAGIISSLNRSIQARSGVLELIQTDAAINPGNSGGPLVNTKGQVVAINTANMPYAQGIGFAVPINTAKSILKELIERGKVTRPWIGVSSMRVTPQLARYYGLPASEGALIAKVEPYSPADDAGLRRGDIIEGIDGDRVEDPSQIASHVRKKHVNDQLTLTINRYGRQLQIPIQVDERP
ncbi:putative protease DO family protein [Candidatus Nitrososphaera gargensis Ga9.2]|uniref:Putative protease DO family protein n=1 Tax=Nitrososphaera gargensis (strain Ga9.2) TaxID=1237085 RepID=K0IMB1_NITGG|nr:trypsin-like peptidase domain-containing protein [Candidatus Nitrososphaera gargensis]AFU60152.1 putative protease DO family protein [Candidatus Nitrososphaera gargensis Ga9.2]